MQRRMALYTFALVLAFIAVARSDDSCPKAEELKPCTCDGEGLNCMGDTTLDQIRRAFKASFKYRGVRSVWIQGTKIDKVPKDMFNGVKAQSFYIEVNAITNVEMEAFDPSKRSMHTLSFFGNKLKSFPFGYLDQFERLGTLNLARNEIEEIPSGLKSRSIGFIILAQNKISKIAMNAFADLPSLTRLELSMNSLTTLEPMSFAMKSHAAGLQINLGGNFISVVSSSAFTGTSPYGLFFSSNKLQSLKEDAFSNLVTRIAQKGGFIEVSGNPLTCKGCDYSWIVTNKDILHKHIIGFTCRDSKQMVDLTKEYIDCRKRRVLSLL